MYSSFSQSDGGNRETLPFNRWLGRRGSGDGRNRRRLGRVIINKTTLTTPLRPNRALPMTFGANGNRFP